MKKRIRKVRAGRAVNKQAKQAAVVRKLQVQLEILESLERTALLRAKAKRIRIREVQRDIKIRSGKN